MNALLYIKSSWPTIRGNAAMFIGKVFKVSTNPNKGPRKNLEAPLDICGEISDSFFFHKIGCLPKRL
jgi:hypothetical protein